MSQLPNSAPQGYTQGMKLFGQGVLRIKVGGGIDCFTFRAVTRKEFLEIMMALAVKLYPEKEDGGE